MPLVHTKTSPWQFTSQSVRRARRHKRQQMPAVQWEVTCKCWEEEGRQCRMRTLNVNGFYSLLKDWLQDSGKDWLWPLRILKTGSRRSQCTSEKINSKFSFSQKYEFIFVASLACLGFMVKSDLGLNIWEQFSICRWTCAFWKCSKFFSFKIALLFEIKGKSIF